MRRICMQLHGASTDNGTKQHLAVLLNMPDLSDKQESELEQASPQAHWYVNVQQANATPTTAEKQHRF